ncbi:OmpW/AlkL family protein [Sulfitobacter donghicola]|uniref:Membrane protein n=1 Tax=Sulfitobacter donghicola DSW-25 = KCTC 12864 = JCM 14565 TaxID=1300350 RepID=A0A073IHZ9_9RHOB|nr:OmpW family outer membrane protein [Sulfitobacter donghicola]KEJ89409.1 membrane protein [Sulfitobacter donghicola DSW-25 = KCTC 12864 = JCM 14565]KIN69226.1 Outer membrane protein OmpW [Sulfitobacter donghicola DSW-25 = KCTC 12864 = JCM 14565]
MKTTFIALAVAALAATSAAAQSQGDFTLGLGIASVVPKSGNGTLAGGAADIGNDVRPTITAEYFVRDNLGIELLAATPFEHDINIDGLGFAGTTQQLPPTLSLNYHFPTNSAFKPYIGAGINYTAFFKEESSLGTLELEDGFGFAVQVGMDYELKNGSALRANLRWIDIDSEATLDGASIGEAEIDPYVLNFAYVMKF